MVINIKILFFGLLMLLLENNIKFIFYSNLFCLMIKKILKLTLILFYFYFYSSVINAQTPLAQDPKRNDWGYSAGFVVKWDSEKISDYYINTSVAKKYQTKNPIIVCLDKRGDAYKLGIKLYDEILEVNGAEFKGHFKTMEKFEVKIKRDNKILNFKNLSPMEFFSEDNICVDEFADRVCLNEIFKNTHSKDLWIKVLECCEANNVSLIPFINDNIPMKINSLSNILEDKRINLDDKIKYSKKAIEEVSKIEAMREKKSFLKFPAEYHRLVAGINNLNLNKQGFKDDKYIFLENEKNLNRIKEYLNEKIYDDKILIDEKNIKIIITYIDTLLERQELDFLEKKFKIMQKNVGWDDEFAINYYSDFYIRYLNIYFQQKEKKKFKNLLNNSIEQLKKKPKNANQIVQLYNLYSYGFSNILFYEDSVEKINKETEKNFKILEQIASDFEGFDNKLKAEIIKKNSIYIANTYHMLGHWDSLLNFSGKRPHYSLLALEANTKYKLPEQNVIVFSVPIVLSAISDGNFSLITKTLLNIKNVSNDKKNNKDLAIAYKNSVPLLVTPLVNIGLFKEAEELIDIMEKNFSFDINNLQSVQKIHLFFYYTAKSRVEINRLKFDEAIISLEKILKLMDTKFFSYGKHSQFDLTTVLVSEIAVPQLLNLYVQKDKNEKFEELIKIIFGNNFSNLSEKNLDGLVFLSNENWYNPLLSYAIKKNDKEKISLISNYLEKNSRKIINKSDYHASEANHTSWDSGDILLELSYLLSLTDAKDFYLKFLEKSNELLKKKYDNEIFNSVWKPSILKLDQKVKVLEISSKKSQSQELIDKSYQLSQTIKNITTTRDLNRALLSRQGAGSDIYNSYFKLQREINLSLNSTEELTKNLLAEKNQELAKIEDKLKKDYPEYLSLQEVDYPSISDIQKKLNKDEIVLDYFISDNSFALVAIKKDDYRIFTKKFKSSEINSLSLKVKRSLNGIQGVKPYEVLSAFELNKLFFLDFKEYFGDIKKFIIIPDGFLNEIPLHALPKENGPNCIDCSKVKWNVDENTFVYLPSTDFYAKAEKKNILTQLFKFDTKDLVPKEITKVFSSIFGSNEKILQDEKSTIKVSKAYFGMGDPDLYLEKNNLPKKTDLVEYKNFFRSIGNKENFDTKKIKEIYGPVAGSAEEVTTAAKFFNSTDNLVLLKKDATETKIKSTDFSKFKVVHFATHGEVSGFIQGINQPFLVMSPPNFESEIDDGLLMMNEIMQLNINADIVILSACNTGSVEDQYSGSFSGLAKAFFISGAKSLLVSNWYVETKSTQKLVTKFVKNFSSNNLSFAENLHISMKEFIKEDPKNSHPIYWAPFVFVGQDRVVNSTF